MNISTVVQMLLSIFFIRVLLYKMLSRTNVALFPRPYHLEKFSKALNFYCMKYNVLKK